jgi:glycosyltransferase involved in cell wall biosynthesis
LAVGLARRYVSSVLTTDLGAKMMPRVLTEAGVEVRRFRAVEVAHTPLSPGLFWGTLRLPRGSVLHAHIAQALLPEMVAVSAALRGHRLVLHFHLDVAGSGALGWLLPAYKRLLLGRVMRRADAVIVLSPTQQEFVRHHYGVDQARVHVLQNGVSESFFQTGVRTGSTTGRPCRLLFVGRLSSQKNVARLLRSLALLDVSYEAVIVGDGELRTQLETLAAQLDVPVTFVGAQHGDALLDWYAWADVFVLPSNSEGAPLAVLEAMAAGLPVVATDVVGTRDLLRDVGLLTEPSDGALAEGLRSLICSEASRAALGESSRRAARALNWDDAVMKLEGIYEGLQ